MNSYHVTARSFPMDKPFVEWSREDRLAHGKHKAKIAYDSEEICLRVDPLGLSCAEEEPCGDGVLRFNGGEVR